VNLTGWSKSLGVTADGAGIVSHAGLALLRHLRDAWRGRLRGRRRVPAAGHRSEPMGLLHSHAVLT
jgi:hypothetical protein